MGATSYAAPKARGVIFIHSAPRALCSHLEWTIGGVLGASVDVSWRAQPAVAGAMAGELYWEAQPGTAATLASALRAWEQIRFEVTEDASGGELGSRVMFTPSLGLFHGATDAAGNLQLSEDRIRFAMETSGRDMEALRSALTTAIGAAWDDELEVFRHVGDSAAVVWLHSAS